MASIQIHEIETPMEDLSYDVAGNITGGGIGELLDSVFDLVRDVLAFCKDSGAEDPVVCVVNILQAIDMYL